MTDLSDLAAIAVAPHPVRTASIPWVVFKALTSRACLPMLRYIGTVIACFLMPQFIAVLWPRRHTIVNVDHALDAQIPFEPDRVAVYLGFVQIWIRGLSVLRRQLGPAANADIANFLDELSNAYVQARLVYRRCLSTTRRPAKPANAGFRLIYAIDPHFNCVPSLHVMIVCQTFLEIQAIYSRHGQAELGESLVADLRTQAVAISESVVFVKQHSINCLSAALYMTSNLRSDFGPTEALDFANDLFLNQVPEIDRQAIRSHVVALYRQFMADNRAGTLAYTDVLVDFLRSYRAAAAT